MHRIVPMAESYIESFRAAIDSVARERRYLALLDAGEAEVTVRFVQEMAEAGDPQFVALEGERVVGWCDIRHKPWPTLKHSGTLGMGVIGSHRRQGIGTALIAATLTAARDRGFTRVELTVRVDNPAARRLYERHGFEVEGVVRRHMLVDGEYHDSHLMSVLY